MIFIYEILKMIFFTRFIKKPQFFFEKKKKKWQNFRLSLDYLKVNNNLFRPQKCTVGYLYLLSYMARVKLSFIETNDLPSNYFIQRTYKKIKK